MADLDDVTDTKNYHLNVPARHEGFFLKGSHALDWGMQNRLARVFNPDSGRTVMLHGPCTTQCTGHCAEVHSARGRPGASTFSAES